MRQINASLEIRNKVVFYLFKWIKIFWTKNSLYSDNWVFVIWVVWVRQRVIVSSNVPKKKTNGIVILTNFSNLTIVEKFCEYKEMNVQKQKLMHSIPLCILQPQQYNPLCILHSLRSFIHSIMHTSILVIYLFIEVLTLFYTFHIIGLFLKKSYTFTS